MQLHSVTDAKTEKMFLDTARVIYRKDKPGFVPFDNDIKGIFDPANQSLFQHTALQERWVLTDDAGKLQVGLPFIAQPCNTYEQPTGGIGFFECTDNNEYAFILFDTAKVWLKEKGMEAMDGPINFWRERTDLGPAGKRIHSSILRCSV